MRYAAVTLGMVAAVWLFLFAGDWQWGKHVARDLAISQVEQAATSRPAPAATLLQVGAETPDALHRQVTATGRYDLTRQILVRFRALNGQPGSYLLAPLIVEDGPALLVVRGFVPQVGAGGRPADIPAPPAGTVEVIGRVAADESGSGAGGDPRAGEIRFVDVSDLAGWLPYEVYGNPVHLVAQTPAPPQEVQVLPPPDIAPGPYLSYGVQWYLFALTAVAAWTAIGVREVREHGRPVRRGRGRTPPPG